jgi:peptidylprolyl isomerase
MSLRQVAEVYTVKKIGIAILGIFMLTVIAAAGCATAQAKTGDKVQVNYTGKLSDGTVFDTSVGHNPLEFTLGDGKVIPGFEKAVLGMKIGEKKTVTVPASDAYGPRQEDLVIEIAREKLPTNITPEVGMRLQSTTKSGATITLTITKVTDTAVTLDANPLLAGKDLTFEIVLLKIL